MGRAMEIISECTYPKLFKPSHRRLFLFVTSIARTNLEAEVIQRGGSLCSKNALRYKPKRECLGKFNCLHYDIIRRNFDGFCTNSFLTIYISSDFSASFELIVGVFTAVGQLAALAILRVFVRSSVDQHRISACSLSRNHPQFVGRSNSSFD